MSQTILLLDYEPRTILRVTEALTPFGFEVAAVKDVDAAVAACAKVEPRAVLITSVLPRLKVEDAITQLRARAGLRYTPFVILMSGYTGSDPLEDATRLGAQDIVAKPFSNEDLAARVRAAVKAGRAETGIGPDTRADMLDALRRSAGITPDRGTVTSEELFGDLGDLMADEPQAADTQRIKVQPVAPAPPPAAEAIDTAATQRLTIPRPAARAPQPDTAVDRALESTLADMRETQKPRVVREDTGGASVDQLLSQTLSGLDVKVAARTAQSAPAPSAPAQPARPAPPRAPEAQAPAATGTLFGQYDLQELIATGGMAEVWKARMRGVEGFQKIVAIKRILPHLTDNDEFVTMFIDEAKLAAQLQHPNIIHIYDLGKLERSYYIAMEYIDGKDLRTILRQLEEKSHRMPLGLALFIGSRLAAALDYAHRKRDLQGQEMVLVHRDVSPQNVLISYDGDIKLCDFGIAKAASKASHTRAGALKGKLQYMSPEQAWGKDIDQRSDIFSLGLVLYEMLTGRKAFAGDSELSILEQVRSPRLMTPRDIDPSIPPEVERVVLKALMENRDERYQLAAEMATDLANILQSLRPAPGASELGSFLADLSGRARPSLAAAPQARPAVTATPTPKPAPAPPRKEAADKPVQPPPAKPKGKSKVVEPEPVVEVSEVIEPARRMPVPLVIGGLVAAVAVIAVIYVVIGGGKKSTQPPTPEMLEMARQAAQAEVARQEGQLRERLTREAGGTPGGDTGQPTSPTPVAAAESTTPVATPTARPATAPTVAPRTTAPALQATPAAVPVAPVTAPTAAPQAIPTQAPPLPTAVAPAPTAAVPAVATRPPLVADQPAVRQGDLVEMSADVTPPELLSSVRPVFPPIARRQRSPGGPVILKVLVDENGSVADSQVLRTPIPDYGFTRAAQDAVRQWRFKPATSGGVRVKVYSTQTVVFTP